MVTLVVRVLRGFVGSADDRVLPARERFKTTQYMHMCMHMSFHTPQLSRGLKAAKHCIVSAAISAWLFAPAHPKSSPRATSELQFFTIELFVRFNPSQFCRTTLDGARHRQGSRRLITSHSMPLAPDRDAAA